MDVKKMLYNKNPLSILSYISLNPKDIYGSMIARELNINQGGTSVILKQFAELGILESKELGRTIIYNVEVDSPVIKSFRVFENVLELQPLIQLLKPFAYKIILFGSCARGEDTIQSDIDLYILSEDDQTEAIQNVISDYQDLDRQINYVLVSPYEEIKLAEDDPAFLEEVRKGITLWEGVYYDEA